MITKVYTVYDTAVAAFMTPFFCRSHGEAIRSFSDAINDEKSNLAKHLQDYSLFYIGDFDDSSGDIVKPLAPERLLSGSEALIKS